MSDWAELLQRKARELQGELAEQAPAPPAAKGPPVGPAGTRAIPADGPTVIGAHWLHAGESYPAVQLEGEAHLAAIAAWNAVAMERWRKEGH